MENASKESWHSRLRERDTPPTFVLLDSNTTEKMVHVSLNEDLSVLESRIRSVTNNWRDHRIFIFVGARHLKQGTLRQCKIRSGTRIRVAGFGGRRVGFRDVFTRPKRGFARVEIKTLGESMPEANFVFDVQPGDTVLGVKLMVESECQHLHHSNLVVYSRPLGNQWSVLNEVDDHSTFKDLIKGRSSLYIRERRAAVSKLKCPPMSICATVPLKETSSFLAKKMSKNQLDSSNHHTSNRLHGI